ncbi:MAG: hypothetical protein ACRDZO_04340 [Egibacteraceae bacterium]
MGTTIEATRAPGQWRSAERVRLPRRAEAVTLVLSLWLIVGLFVDGWAHMNLAQLETFFTPWHALFYSGFTAVAGWIGWQVVRGQEAGRRGLAAVPAGYGLGIAGLAIFAAGGAGDLAWHQVFGIEQELDALFSPTHIMLLAGMALIVTSPLRAAWAAPDDHDADRLRTFLPVVLSLALSTALISFFLMWTSAFLDSSPVVSAARWRAEWGPYPGDGRMIEQGLTSVIITNLVLIAPLLYLIRRWLPPFGAVTVLFSFVAVLTSALVAFEMAWSIVPAVVAGLAADLLIRRVRPSTERPAAYRAVAVLVPAILWSVYYLTLGLRDPIVWVPELWSGTIIYAALTGLVLAQMMLPVRARTQA